MHQGYLASVPDGVIVKTDKQVDPRNAGSQLVANLQALGVPAN